MKSINKILFITLCINLLGCARKENCSINDNDFQFQKFSSEKEFVILTLNDDGSFGRNVSLKVCNKANKKLIEEIFLRGEDYLPRIDSIVGCKVYIKYSFPRAMNSEQIEELKFEDVVLGEALINRSVLKYSYFFYNTKQN